MTNLRLMRSPWCDSYLKKRLNLQAARAKGWEDISQCREFPVPWEKKQGKIELTKCFVPSLFCGGHTISFWFILEADQENRIQSLQYISVQTFANGRTTYDPMELYPSDEEDFGREMDTIVEK